MTANLNITERHAKFRREMHHLVTNIYRLRQTPVEGMSADDRAHHEKCLEEDNSIFEAIVEIYDRYGDAAVLPQTAAILDPILDARPINEDEEPYLTDDQRPYYEAFKRELDRILWTFVN